MSAWRWAHHDLVLLPLPDAPSVEPAAVVAHLASRRVCAGVLDGERIGVVGGVAVRVATADLRVAVADTDHEVHAGPDLRDVALGLAYRVGALVHVADGLVVDSAGTVLDDERVLAGVRVSERQRVVTAWRDDDLLVATMLAGELGGRGSAVLVDGWSVTAWDDDAALTEHTLPLPRRHHPVVLVTRSGDLRTVLVTPTPGADALQVGWVPSLAPVLAAPPGSAADRLLHDLQVTAAPELDDWYDAWADDWPDDWPRGFDPALRSALVAAQRGPGDDFLGEVVALLGLPRCVARLADAVGPEAATVDPDEPALTRVGDRSALQAGWDHVRSPLPESDVERRLREMPTRTVVRQVVGSLVLAAGLVVLVLVRDFRFVPEWLLWGAAAFAVFNAVTTLWFRRRLGPRGDGS